MKKVLIIANPGSGKGKALQYAEKLQDMLTQTYQVDIQILETEKEGDAKKWAQKYHSDTYDTIFCLGGDGTVNEVVSGLMENDQPPHFAFIPLGTVNDLARSVGLSLNPDQAIEQFQNIRLETIDIAKANQSYFVNILALGSIPEAVLKTESEVKNKIGALAYFIDGLKAFIGDKPLDLLIETPTETYQVTSQLILVTLTSSVAGLEKLLPQAHLGDGQARLFAFKQSLALSSIQTLIEEQGLPDQSLDTDHLLSLIGKEFKISLADESSRQKHLANIDGDKGPSLPLDIKVFPQALKLWVPCERD